MLHLLAPTLQQATTNPHFFQGLLDTHRQVWVSLLWDHSSFLLGHGVHKVLFVSSKSLFPQSCVSSGGSMVGFLATSSKRAYAIPRSIAPRAPASAAVHWWPISAGDTQTHFWLSLYGVSRFVWALQLSLVGMGFNSKCNFVPPTIFWGFLLCPWIWGIFFSWNPTFSCQQLFSSEL